MIAPGEVPPGLQPYVEKGGHVIVASSVEPPFEMGKVVKLWKDPDGAYFRIRDHAMFPSLKSIDITFFYGDYLQVEGTGPLTLIPPSLYGPPELVKVGWKDTDAPGLIFKDY